LVSFVFGHEEHEGKHEGHEGISWVSACAATSENVGAGGMDHRVRPGDDASVTWGATVPAYCAAGDAVGYRPST
jgi:hypothetical protein